MVQQVSQFETADDLFIYPESDGQPMAENTIQFRWIVTIKENLEILFAANPDVFIAGDLFWYPIEKDTDTKYAPDTMVVFGRPKGDRGSYIQCKEGNIPPQVVFEVLSPSNTKAEMQNKLDFYNKYGVEEYYLYNPYKNNLTGWLRDKRNLKQITNINGWTSPRLSIKFVLTSTTLEIYRPDGRKFLTPVELEEQRQQAEKLADAERQRADTQQQRADAERQRADAQQQRADAERQARLDGVPKLLSMGLSVEQVAQALSLTTQEVEEIRNI
ncbi:MAG: Uma2 family endonuclease [Scytonematopsis contorta HA4267-MV1]|jgi:Uma2 family endonuclease|nr:Uma2 family endonuclease [Scytonematopsis contorta HA4267-MV1]